MSCSELDGTLRHLDDTARRLHDLLRYATTLSDLVVLLRHVGIQLEETLPHLHPHDIADDGQLYLAREIIQQGLLSPLRHRITTYLSLRHEGESDEVSPRIAEETLELSYIRRELGTLTAIAVDHRTAGNILWSLWFLIAVAVKEQLYRLAPDPRSRNMMLREVAFLVLQKHPLLLRFLPDAVKKDLITDSLFVPEVSADAYLKYYGCPTTAIPIDLGSALENALFETAQIILQSGRLRGREPSSKVSPLERAIAFYQSAETMTMPDRPYDHHDMTLTFETVWRFMQGKTVRSVTHIGHPAVIMDEGTNGRTWLLFFGDLSFFVHQPGLALEKQFAEKPISYLISYPGVWRSSPGLDMLKLQSSRVNDAAVEVRFRSAVESVLERLKSKGSLPLLGARTGAIAYLTVVATSSLDLDIESKTALVAVLTALLDRTLVLSAKRANSWLLAEEVPEWLAMPGISLKGGQPA